MRSSNIGHRLKHGFALQQIPSISSTRCTMCIVHTCPRGIQIWSYLSKYLNFLINAVCFGEGRGRIFGIPSPELTCWISHLKQDKPRVLCRGEKEQKGRNYNYFFGLESREDKKPSCGLWVHVMPQGLAKVMSEFDVEWVWSPDVF